jgi:hypothetical protein
MRGLSVLWRRSARFLFAGSCCQIFARGFHRSSLRIFFESKRSAFTLLRSARYFSFACPKEKYPRENDTPLGACGASRPGKSVRWGRAFRQDSCPDEKESASLPIPLRACRPHLTAVQGAPFKSSAHPARRLVPLQAMVWSPDQYIIKRLCDAEFLLA